MRRSAAALALPVVLLALATAATAAQAATRPKAPPITGKTVTGGTASLAKLKGKPVFINVWSSW
jgi:hypothetical protein